MAGPVNPVTLPGLPSALLRLAVKDVNECERMPDRALDMTSWLCRWDRTCYVCMAGAVMDRTMGLTAPASPDFLEESVGDKLLAIDSLRIGALFAACSYLGLPDPPLDLCAQYRHAIARGWSPTKLHAPWGTYVKQAAVLEKAGY